MAAAEEEVSPFFQGAVEEAAGDQLRFCASVQCSLTADLWKAYAFERVEIITQQDAFSIRHANYNLDQNSENLAL